MAYKRKGSKSTARRTPRRLNTGWTGCPTDKGFHWFKDHARTELDRAEVISTLKQYAKDNFDRRTQKRIFAAPDWALGLPYYAAAAIEWRNLGHELPEGWDFDQMISAVYSDLASRGDEAIAQKKPEIVTRVAPRKTPGEIVKERTDALIAELEHVLDQFFEGTVTELDLYGQLKGDDAAYKTAKWVHDYYEPILEEAKQLISRSCPQDLNEAYSHWNKNQRQQYTKLLTQIVEDCKKYMTAKSAVRKTRKPRAKGADKQVAKVSYLKQSDEFKLVSIDPINIVGAKRLYAFNPRTRTLTEYVSNARDGFQVKGSSLQNVDFETSREARVKPEFIEIVMNEPPSKVNAAWRKLKSQTTVPTERISRGMLLLKAINR